MFVFGLHSTSDDCLSDLSHERWSKHKKSPLRHQKIKCSFLDYVQLLMIGWAIWAKNIDWNAKNWKRPPKSSKNKMFIFGLHSTSDDWLSDQSDERWLKCKKKRPPKSSKNKMFIFWWSTRRLPEDHKKTVRRLPEDQQKTSRRLPEDWQKTSRRQTEDYQKSSRRPAEDCQKTARRPPEDYQKTARRLPEDCQKTTRPSAEQSEQITLTKIQKNEKGPQSHQKIKCSFLDYIQLLMIGRVIWVMNGDWNAKKRPPKSSKNKMFIFWWPTRRLPEDHKKTVRRLPEDQQKTSRRLPEDCEMKCFS